MRTNQSIIWCLCTLFMSSLVLLSGCTDGRQKDSNAVVGHLREVGKLELVEQRSEEVILISGSGESLSTIGSLDDAFTYLDDLFRVGDRVGVYSFSHYAIAYLDLTELTTDDVRIHSGAKSVHLQLPKIQVEPIGRSGQIKLLHERVTGNRRPITTEERSKIQEKATQQALERLKPGSTNYNDLVRQAKDQAKSYFTGLLRSRGYEEVTIDFD